MNGMGASHTNCTLGAWTRWHLQGNEIENKRETEWDVSDNKNKNKWSEQHTKK